MIKGLPATEPSVDGIQAALGLSGYRDYAVLIRPDLYGPKINIVKFWAKFQPMHSTQLHKLTDAYRAANGYGIKDNYNYEYNDTTDVNNAFNRAKNGDYSLYREKPTGDIDTSPFRPWDYYSEDGTMAYNNEAVSPFSFELEEITDRGFAQITAMALPDYQLPDGNITIKDLRAVGGLNSIVSLMPTTCFGLLYKKNGGSVQVLGGDGKYPAFMENGDERTCDIQLEGDGVYQFAYIILNTSTKRFITLPYPVQEVTVTSTGIERGYVEVFGGYEYNSAGTQLTVRDLTIIPRGAQATAGNVALYICSPDTPSNKVESQALYTTSYAYEATAKDTERVLFTSRTITANGWDARAIVPWVVTTTSAGEVYKTQLEYVGNEGDIA